MIESRCYDDLSHIIRIGQRPALFLALALCFLIPLAATAVVDDSDDHAELEELLLLDTSSFGTNGTVIPGTPPTNEQLMRRASLRITLQGDSIGAIADLSAVVDSEPPTAMLASAYWQRSSAYLQTGDFGSEYNDLISYLANVDSDCRETSEALFRCLLNEYRAGVSSPSAMQDALSTANQLIDVCEIDHHEYYLMRARVYRELYRQGEDTVDFASAAADYKRASGLGGFTEEFPWEISVPPTVLQRPLLIFLEWGDLYAERAALTNPLIRVEHYARAANFYIFAKNHLGRWEQEFEKTPPPTPSGVTPSPTAVPDPDNPISFPPEWRVQLVRYMILGGFSSGAVRAEADAVVRDISRQQAIIPPSAELLAWRAKVHELVDNDLAARADAVKAWQLRFGSEPIPETTAEILEELGIEARLQ